MTRMTRDQVDTVLTVAISVIVSLVIVYLIGCNGPTWKDAGTDTDTETESDEDTDTDVYTDGCLPACQWPSGSFCALEEGRDCLNEIRGCRSLVGGGTIGLDMSNADSSIPDLGCLESIDGAIWIHDAYNVTDISAVYSVESLSVRIEMNFALDVCIPIAHYRESGADLSTVCIPTMVDPSPCSPILSGC